MNLRMLRELKAGQKGIMAKVLGEGAIRRRILDMGVSRGTEIFNSIRQINYGEVVITIHDSKIVQIEKREKKRFPK